MSIHKEGYRIIIITLAMVAMIIAIINYFHPSQSIIHYLVYTGIVALLVFVVRFFRNPERPITVDESILIAPADGVVVEVAEADEKEYFNDQRLKISIFMSPNNVHKNWYPVSGTVRFFRHHAGKFLVAWHPKSSDLNERTTVVIEKENGVQILVRQIAGAVAQRICCYSEVNKKVKQGEELGFIKFGSRVDVFLPTGSEVLVSKNQKVIGCNTIIARF